MCGIAGFITLELLRC